MIQQIGNMSISSTRQHNERVRSASSASRDMAVTQVAVLNNGQEHYMASLRNKSNDRFSKSREGNDSSNLA